MPKHIVRLISVIIVLFAAGAIAKWYFTADSFYKYGHYRADSVPQIAAQEPVFQTPRYCQTCHSERHAQWSASSHKSVACENCHGPVAERDVLTKEKPQVGDLRGLSWCGPRPSAKR